jgi:hypothetical protein
MSDQETGRAQGPTPTQVASGARRGGTVIGIVLVVVGAIMLFGRYVAWLDLFRLWPLIIVIGGIAQVFHQHGREPAIKRVAEGIGSIAVGLVLLCNTFGAIPWSVWITVLSLWPLLLVALGIELLGKGLGLDWVRALSNVLLTLGLLFAVFVLPAGTVGFGFVGLGGSGSGTHYEASAPHDPAVTEGTAVVKTGATRLTVKAGSQLARVSGYMPTDMTPELKSSVTSGIAEVTIDEPSQRSFLFTAQDRSVDLELDSALDWKRVEFDIGAIEGNADLRDLRVEQVKVNVGASDLTITLGTRANDVAVDVSGGAANITIKVPANAAVTVEAKSGLSNITVPAGFRRVSGIPLLGDSSWTSDGSGGPHIAVSMQSGVSNLTIQTY